MNWTKEIHIIFLLIAILVASFAYAENIKNYGGCDVCPGEIHYGPDETKKIMGPKGLKLVSKMNGRKIIKIDLEGVLKNGSAEDKDAGYELIISGSEAVFHIRDILDKSYILIVTDHVTAHQTGKLDNWRPEIYLQSGKAEKINLDDSLTLAWEKFRKSNIYQWVISGESEIQWPALFRDKILYAIELMGDE